MAALSALLGWTMAGRVLRPVHAITAAARRASEENLGERIALTGPEDELKELADTFDAMLVRLDAAFASQRRFVANASHELRTPLTVMRTAIDVTLAKPERTPAQLEAMAAEVRQAACQAERLVEALLTLARSDRGTGPRSVLDLAVLAEDALDAAAPAIRAGSLRVTSELEPGMAAGDPVLVERLVCNLIDNAVRHNVSGGWLEVASGSREGLAFLTVANSGPVIDEAEVAALFEPFHRRYKQGGRTLRKAAGSACPSSRQWSGRIMATSPPYPSLMAAWRSPYSSPSGDKGTSAAVTRSPARALWLAAVAASPTRSLSAVGRCAPPVRGRRRRRAAARRSAWLPSAPGACRGGRRRRSRRAASSGPR